MRNLEGVNEQNYTRTVVNQRKQYPRFVLLLPTYLQLVPLFYRSIQYESHFVHSLTEKDS